MAPLLENEKNKSSFRFDDKDKTNILEKQFSSVFTHETDLNANKSCAPEELHTRLLLELADRSQ